MSDTEIKKIVLTGGGTAGHVTPNIALIPHLKELGGKRSCNGRCLPIPRPALSGTG